MNNSTEGVTLIAGFVQDIIDQYEGKAELQKKLREMASGIDLSDPNTHVPISLYNSMCDWIESQIGEANVIRLGRKIGNRAFQSMEQMGMVKAGSAPLEIMEALKKVAESVISDPGKRGWEIIEKGNKHIVMRRTQTFNGTLQFGLLDELIRKSKVFTPKVEYLRSVKNGDEFDDYRISWL